jgi:hypothetical protein
MNTKTVFCGLLMGLELFHSIMTTAVGMPTTEALRQISLRIFKQRSKLATHVEYITGSITFVVSVVIIMFVKSSTLHSKVTLFFLPLVGTILGAVVSVTVYTLQDTISAFSVYIMFAVVSLSGGGFLYETFISDLVAMIVPSTQQRVSLYMLMKGIKLGGLCLVQLTPQFGVTEEFIIKWFTLASAAFLLVAHFGMEVLVMKKITQDVELEVLESTAEEGRLCEAQQARSDTNDTPQVRPNVTVYHALPVLLITLHSAQRGEYKFTYYFLHDRLNFAPDTVRLLNGGQYFLFFVCLTVSGYILKRVKSARASLIAFTLSMLLSVAARVCQIVAWNEPRLEVWCLSALLSTPGPIAYQVLQGVVYQVLNDARASGFIVMTADRLLSLPFLQLYQWADQVWLISPFYVTLMLMIITTVGGLSTKRMRSWLKGNY